MVDSTLSVPQRSLAHRFRTAFGVEYLLGGTKPMQRLGEHLLRVAEAQCPALIRGETGSGKELLAAIAHRAGPRRAAPCIPINCAALTVTLAESQLFGHERGAFTGAAGASLGVFRAAAGGVVVLDEIGDMPLALQPKLLRVLEQREVMPVGAARPVPVDAQVIAVTNRDLEAEVAAGRFREDLYYRLNLVELVVPPLRERVTDIPDFIEFFSNRYAARYGRPVWRPDADLLRQFCEFSWPGNIRQLSHVIEQIYVLDALPDLFDAKPHQPAVATLATLNLDTLRREAVTRALGITHGRKGRAAQLLGVHANTLTRLLRQLDLKAN
jgi:DNA-binding NtrC family response regulator